MLKAEEKVKQNRSLSVAPVSLQVFDGCILNSSVWPTGKLHGMLTLFFYLQILGLGFSYKIIQSFRGNWIWEQGTITASFQGLRYMLHL